ncbi:MAG TPA: helix-turn-helix domain-containing protein, partial [Solirubrobacteraceae bacterium]
MLGNDYKTQTCSIAGALEVVGERWSLLILRDVFLGLRRFDQIQANLGIARNVLQARLERLIEQDVLERSLYQERPPRYEYRLTEKGIDLWPIIVSLMQWGDRYAAPADGPPVLLEHRGCGGRLDEHRICERCG